MFRWKIRHLLRWDSKAQQQRAIQKFRSSYSPQVRETLLFLLTTPERGLQEHAAEVLGELREEQAFDPLLSIAQDYRNGSFSRVAAVRTLGQLADQRAIGPLLSLLKSHDLAVVVAAVNALEQLGHTHAIDHLCTDLWDPDSYYIEGQAARALGQLRDKRALEPLLGRLRDTQPVVKKVASLLECDQEEVEPFLECLLRSDVRITTLHVLGKQGNLVDALGRISEEEWALKRDIEKALKDIGIRRDPSLALLLIPLLSDTSADVAIELLYGLGRAAIEPLVALLPDLDSVARSRIASVLGKLDWQPQSDFQQAALAIAQGDWQRALRYGASAPEALLGLFIAVHDSLWRQEEHWTKVIEMMDQLGDGSVDAVLSVLQRSEWWIRSSAVQLLGQRGDERVLTGLDLRLRQTTAEALVSLAGRARTPVLLALGQLLHDTDKFVAYEAVSILGKIKHAEATKLLADALSTTDPLVNHRIMTELHSLGWMPPDTSARIRWHVVFQEWEAALLLGEEAFQSLGEKERLELMKGVSDQIERLENRTGMRPTGRFEWYDAEHDMEIYEEFPDPDLEGIRKLIESMPASLQKLYTGRRYARYLK